MYLVFRKNGAQKDLRILRCNIKTLPRTVNLGTYHAYSQRTSGI